MEGEEEREVVEETRELIKQESSSGLFGKVIKGYDWRDVGESLLGSLIFGFAMVVEGGTLEIGEFTANNPIFFYLSIFLTILVVIKILYVIDIQKVEVVNPLLGFIPRRVIGVLLISFLTALGIMTAWGRVNWSTPWIALNQVVIAWTMMAIGASLGDILPGT